MNRRRMDAERGRVFHPDKRSRKLLLIVILQSVLVAACLGVTLYVLWGVQTPDDVHIQFVPIADIRANDTLTLGAIHSSNMMGMVDDKNAFYSNCTGPYVLYLEVCYTCLEGMEAAGTLQLQVVERKEEGEKITHTSSVDLPRLPDGCEAEEDFCKRLHTMAYLKVQEEASLHLYGTNGLKIKSMTVGLNYLLGSRCEF